MEVLIDEFFDFLRRSTFLAEELVAGEGKNFESLWTEFFVHVNHGLVIGGSQSSLACYVDNHNCLFVFESGEINELASDVLDFEVVEGLARCVEFLTSLLEED